MALAAVGTRKMSVHTAPLRSRFAGKSVLVTGGGNGIGTAIVEAFLDEGAMVTLADVDLAGARAASEAIVARGKRTPYVAVGDVSSEADVKRMVEATVREHGRLDVLVNNAAVFVYGEVTDVTESDLDRSLGVNVKGYAFTMKHAIPAMKEVGGGAIVNLSSISAFCAQPGFVPYSITKAAVLQMTRNVAMDSAKHNIRVNAVCPGPILTEATLRHATSQGKTLEELLKEFDGHMLLKRMGQPSEVASAVTFLASSEASFITGASLMVDGGYIIS